MQVMLILPLGAYAPMCIIYISFCTRIPMYIKQWMLMMAYAPKGKFSVSERCSAD
jgi:hypothetical protein